MMNANGLAQDWLSATLALNAASKRLWEAESAIRHYMETEGATAIPAHAVDKATGEVHEYLMTYKAQPEYDREALYAAKEYMHPDQWEDLLTNPAPPVRQVNIVKFKELAKQGGHFKRILDAATRPGTPVLKVSEVNKGGR